MNLEAFFVKTGDRDGLMSVIRSRLMAASDQPGRQPDWGLPPSYDALLANERDRKIALSSSVSGWIQGIESKEVLDFELLRRISDQLETSVIAVQLSEVSGCCGYAHCSDGRVIDQLFSEQSDNPAQLISAYLTDHGISHRLLSFRETFRHRDGDWVVIA